MADDVCKTVPLHKEHPELEELYHAVFQVVFPILIVVGLMTNLVNLAVLTRPAMRTKPYRYV